MNSHLLESQFGALEIPETALRIVNDRAPDVVVEKLIAELAQTNSIPGK